MLVKVMYDSRLPKFLVPKFQQLASAPLCSGCKLCSGKIRLEVISYKYRYMYKNTQRICCSKSIMPLFFVVLLWVDSAVSIDIRIS